MLLKIAVLLVAFTLLCRWAVGKWPWQLGSSIGPQAQKVSAARRLLGVDARADRTEILAAHKLLLTRVHPDRGGSEQKVFEANDARDLLLAELGEPPPLKKAEREATSDDEQSSQD